MSALASSNSSLDKLTKSAASDDLKRQLAAINDLLEDNAEQQPPVEMKGEQAEAIQE